MKKILHFENEPIFMEMYEKKFKKARFDYRVFQHPPAGEKELIKLVLKEKPDLILMDIIMPVMDGFTATKILKSNKSTRDIPIIGLSNLAGEADIKKGLELNMEDFIVAAHYTPQQLEQVIYEYLQDPAQYKKKHLNLINS